MNIYGRAYYTPMEQISSAFFFSHFLFFLGRGEGEGGGEIHFKALGPRAYSWQGKGMCPRAIITWNVKFPLESYVPFGKLSPLLSTTFWW